MSARNFVIGVDVGGTFTDLFFLDEKSGRAFTRKTPSTPSNQAVGFLEGISSGVDDLSTIATVIHGTTVGTNALLERKGAKAGVITTKGFRDVLEMRRRDRPETWGLWGSFDPVVARDRRVEVSERTLADGQIHTKVDPEEVKQAAKLLLERGAESICIFFINAYANAENEQVALAAVKDVWPNDYINASSDILPEIREFERASTTALNAYLQPPVGKYLKNLDNSLSDGGFAGQLLIVQSNGGVMTVDTAQKLPVRTALSGPAAGVIAGAYIAENAGFPNIITCDMGGTSFDVSLVAGGEAALAAQTSIDFGMVVRTPMIEITTIGAGGGSIASIDAGGMLQVGPESAGSDPGPVCYGLGNTRPTVTDANVVLGRINADRPIGGKLARLDVAAAEAALEEHIGKPLGLSAVQAAEAVIRVANSRMAGAIRLVSIERGFDPEQFVAMPFGGGGSLHTGALIKEVGLANALVPRYPGVTSALGCVIADMRHDFVHTLNDMVDSIDISSLDDEMVRTDTEGRRLLDESGVTLDELTTVFELDMSYLGQTHTVPVAIPVTVSNKTTGVTREILRQAFEAQYEKTYGRLLSGIGIRILNLRTSVIGKRPKFDLSLLAPDDGGSIEASRTGERNVFVDGEWHKAAIFDRLSLPIDAEIPGPALLEQPDTTIFIDPDLYGKVDRFGNIVISRKA
ncbi:MAG: hydantoinase/oxoprolinase family protein [Rhodospirillales bacterium]